LIPMGKYQEAIAEMKKGLDLDPLSPHMNTLMANMYIWTGDNERAAQQFRRTIELDSRFILAHAWYSNLLAETGHIEQAIEEWETVAGLGGLNPAQAAAIAAELRKAFQAGGPTGYWKKRLEMTLNELHEGGSLHYPPLAIAFAY